ncbi:MAG: molybdopterin biosynthesis protein MoeB, partial [Gammaproteobacteria bacterium]|nr:molybdopterin biosynthesis protein MoeB [Gammaproteobacteria bacterium]MDX5374158.1 molybdopterin biosynthesis protein MoeB [Gammaproteobacteria bacterium]
MQDADLLRYSRQILLADIGLEGQQRLLDARVLILG